MTTALVSDAPALAGAALAAASQLVGSDLSSLSESHLLDLLRTMEALRRTVEAFDNLCLLCDYHHDRIDTGGWRVVMRDRMPEFIPPVWVDPSQRPRRNHRISRR